LKRRTNHKPKPPPYSHREIADAMFRSSVKPNNVFTWIKIEFYTLVMTVLPHLITLAVWAVIIAAIYWTVKLI
jgi:hypothetical protein